MKYCYVDTLIEHEGDTWLVSGKGIVRDDGMTLCHLVSRTRGRKQKNGRYPIQMMAYVDLSKSYEVMR